MKYWGIILFVWLNSCGVQQKKIEQQDNADFTDVADVADVAKSYLLYDLAENKLIDSYNKANNLIPASLFKLVTAYAALEILGAEHQFKTNILYQGELKEGILDGDIIIQGLGDPSLSYQDLFNIAQLIKLNGIKELRGSLLYDDNYFIRAMQISSDQPASIYNSGLSALLLKENNFAVEFNESKELFTVPKIDYLNFKISNKYKLATYSNSGKWQLNRRRHFLPIRDTSRFFAEILAQNLKNQQISVNKIAAAQNLTNIKHLFSYEGSSFLEVIRDNLQYSENTVSEILLLHIAKKLECQVVNLADATNCLKSWYQGKFPQLSWQDLNWHNGSGLSSSTKISAAHLLEILKALSEKKYKHNFGASLLAVSGAEGTLLTKFREYPLSIWGKTGTMYYVSAVAGYLYDAKRKYAFIIMLNEPDARKKIDNLQHNNSKYYEYRQEIKKAKKWKEEAQKYQEYLIKTWLD